MGAATSVSTEGPPISVIDTASPEPTDNKVKRRMTKVEVLSIAGDRLILEASPRGNLGDLKQIVNEEWGLPSPQQVVTLAVESDGPDTHKWVKALNKEMKMWTDKEVLASMLGRLTKKTGQQSLSFFVSTAEASVCAAAGIQFTVGRITASGTHSGYSANDARLHGKKCWCASDWCAADGQNKRHQWLQVDLKCPCVVTGVATQGHSSYGGHWCKSYKLKVSSDEKVWTDVGLFAANSDANTVVTNTLDHPAAARFVRFCPITCGGGTHGGWAKMRTEIYVRKPERTE